MIKFKLSSYIFFFYNSNVWVNINVYSNIKNIIMFFIYILNMRKIVVEDFSYFCFVSYEYVIFFMVIGFFIVILFIMYKGFN